MPILAAKNILIRPWQPGDETSLAKYANNRKVSRNLRDRFPFPYTDKDARDWVLFNSTGGPVYNFAIEHENEAVGGIGFIPGTDVFRKSAEVGYWLGEPHWGKGLAAEAVSLLVPWAMRHFDLVRVFAGVFSNNPASARVLEKAGFTLESIQRQSVFKDGAVLDQLLYVQLRYPGGGSLLSP